jgi:hypothetical protein
VQEAQGLTFFRASRLDEILPPPDGQDFDPYRDTRYSRIDTPSRDQAVAFAAKDFHECGRVEERLPHPDFPGISDVISAWEVYPDGTTRSIE